MNDFHAKLNTNFKGFKFLKHDIDKILEMIKNLDIDSLEEISKIINDILARLEKIEQSAFLKYLTLKSSTSFDITQNQTLTIELPDNYTQDTCYCITKYICVFTNSNQVVDINEICESCNWRLVGNSIVFDYVPKPNMQYSGMGQLFALITRNVI